MGEFCSVAWFDGRKGCYANLDLRTADHKRRHGPLEEVPPPPTRPGPAPYCMRGPQRPRGVVAAKDGGAPLGESKGCRAGAFRLYQYQVEVHQRNQVNIHDDLQQRAGAFVFAWSTDALIIPASV
jgi:hypothetical protein